MSAECPSCGGTDPAACDRECAKTLERAAHISKAQGLARQAYLARALADKYREEGDEADGNESPRLRDAMKTIAECERDVAILFARAAKPAPCMGCMMVGPNCDGFRCSECGERSDVHLETLDYKDTDDEGSPSDPYRPCADCSAAARAARRSRPTLPPASENFTLALEMSR